MDKEMHKMVENDMTRIDEEILHGNNESRWDLFREMDGKYQVCIADFHEGMYESVPGKNVLYFNTLREHPGEVLENLKLVKAKLTSFLFGANAVQLPALPSTQVNVTTNLHVEVTFEQVRSQIEDMTSLTNDETKEILEKISEIEKAVNSKDSKKTKWEKVKPIIKWLADKSLDVGIKLLPLILKING